MESSDTNWELHIDDRVYKDLRKTSKDYVDKIIGIIESLAFDPYAGDIQKIKGEAFVWRRRVGQYRLNAEDPKPINYIGSIYILSFWKKLLVN